MIAKSRMGFYGSQLVACGWLVLENGNGAEQSIFENCICVDLTIDWSHAGDGNDVKPTKESHLLFSVVK